VAAGETSAPEFDGKGSARTPYFFTFHTAFDMLDMGIVKKHGILGTRLRRDDSRRSWNGFL